MARLAGFEPTTPWFVAKYSIQLSYSREALKYSRKFNRASRPAAQGEAARQSRSVPALVELRLRLHGEPALVVLRP